VVVLDARRVENVAVDRAAGGVVLGLDVAKAGAVARLAGAAAGAGGHVRAARLAVAEPLAQAGRVAGAVLTLAFGIGAGGDRHAGAERRGDIAAPALVA